jgi:hypothetical protein
MTMTLAPGTKLDHYEILGLLGAGGWVKFTVLAILS